MPSEAAAPPRTDPRAESWHLWHADDAKTRLLGIVLVVVMACVLGLAIAAQIGRPIYGDFFAMWSFGRFALTRNPADIYDAAALHEFQLVYQPDLAGRFPFPYPPTYLLPLLSVGALPIMAAWAMWSLAGVAAFVAAALAPAWRSTELLFTAFAPATVMSLVSGQNGLLAGALMVGGVRLMAMRPVFAGVLFGLMSFKPQLGLLIPVALVALRLWRCLAAAAATTLALAGAAAAAFGASIWPAWLAALANHYDGYVVVGNRVRVKMPTITANLELLGVGARAAEIAQVAAALVVAALVWRCLRRRGPDELALAALLVAGFLVTPYALFYDLPPITFALLLFVRATLWAGVALTSGEVAVAAFAFLMPFGQFFVAWLPVPITAAALLLLFGVIVRRALVRPSPIS